MAPYSCPWNSIGVPGISMRQNRYYGSVLTGSGDHIGTFAASRICHLIVILNEIDKRRGRQVKGGSPTGLALPPIPLALVEIPVFSRRETNSCGVPK